LPLGIADRLVTGLPRCNVQINNRTVHQNSALSTNTTADKININNTIGYQLTISEQNVLNSHWCNKSHWRNVTPVTVTPVMFT